MQQNERANFAALKVSQGLSFEFWCLTEIVTRECDCTEFRGAVKSRRFGVLDGRGAQETQRRPLRNRRAACMMEPLENGAASLQ